MSYDFWSTRECAARKRYRCDECGADIAVGQRYERGSGKWEGSDMVTQRLCLTCAEIINETWHTDLWDGEDGFPLGEVRAHLRDWKGIQDATAWARRHRAARLAERNVCFLGLDQEAFLHHMAERYRAKVRRPGVLGWLRIPYSKEWAAGLARTTFEVFLEGEAIGGAPLPFGHPDYDWTASGAEALVDEELHYWAEG